MQLKNYNLHIIGGKIPVNLPCYEIGEILVVDFGEQSCTFEDKSYPRYGFWLKSKLKHPYEIFNVCFNATIEISRRKDESIKFAELLNERDTSGILDLLNDELYKPSFEDGMYLRNLGLKIESELLGVDLPDWHKESRRKTMSVVANTPGDIENFLLDWLLG